jgi:energy-converting hydrogenase Eha subunit C
LIFIGFEIVGIQLASEIRAASVGDLVVSCFTDPLDKIVILQLVQSKSDCRIADLVAVSIEISIERFSREL